MIPIGAYEPRWIMHYSHLNPVPVGDQTYAQAVQKAIETFAQ